MSVATSEASVTESLSRDQIVSEMDRIACAERGIGALAVVRDYQSGRLEAPGEVLEVIALARLLPKGDVYRLD